MSKIEPKKPGQPKKEPSSVISIRVPERFKTEYEARVKVAISNLLKQWRSGR